MVTDRLQHAAAQVDIIDTAGRIIAHPHRHAPSASAGEVLALAHAFEKSWAVAIEADLLVRALAMPMNTEAEIETRELACRTQAVRVHELMAAIRGETQEEN